MVLHGGAGPVISNVTLSKSKITPVLNEFASKPWMRIFSPVEPGPIGWPSERSRVNTESSNRQTARVGPP